MGFGHAHGSIGDDNGNSHGDGPAGKAKRLQIFMKTATYATMHMTVAIIVAYALSGDWKVALAIGTIEPCVQTIAFFFHERFWHKYGTRRQAHAHNAITDSTNPLPNVAHPKD